MKKIDVLKTNEKVKVSLALDVETYELIENSLAGFKLISMLAKSGANTDLLKSKTGESIYSSVTNRSDFMAQIIQTISEEKIFILDKVEYSLNDMTQIFDDLVLASKFNFYVNIPALFSFKDLEHHQFLTSDNIEKMRRMSLKETHNYFFKQFDRSDLNYILDFAQSLTKNTENINKVYTLSLVTIDLNKQFSNDYILYKEEDPKNYDAYISLSDLEDIEPIDTLTIIEKRNSEMMYQFDRETSTFTDKNQTTSDKFVESYIKKQEFLLLKYYEMLMVIMNQPLSEMTTIRILRNQLYAEHNLELKNLLEVYIENKLNLRSKVRETKDETS